MIPFLDLRAQYRSIKPEIDAAVGQVLDSAQFVLGEHVEAFEREFAAFTHTAYGIATNSGTSALHLALLASGIGPGDEVLTVPFTFVATVAAIEYTGATPRFVDVEPRTLTMDVNRIEEAITPKTRAIVPVHLYGQAADLTPILQIAERHGLMVIEDACQAHGAVYKDRPVGSWGHAGCFSFYPGKNLGAYGEGGIVVTDDTELRTRVQMLRDWGQRRKYDHVMKGFNYRMEGLQGTILRVKLRHLPDWNDARREHAAQYHWLLRGSEVQPPDAAPYGTHVYHVYAVRTRQRAALQHRLESNGISTGIHYPVPVHLQPAYSNLGYTQGDFPESERAADEVLSLPMYPELSRTNIEQIAAAVRREAYVA